MPSHLYPLGDMGVAFTRSADGVTWPAPSLIVSGFASASPLADRPWLSIDAATGTVYLVYSYSASDVSGEQIVIAGTTDRGATWSTPIPATAPGHETFGQLAVLPDGTFVLTDFDAEQQTFVARVSKTRGAAFSEPRVIAAQIGAGTLTPGTKTLSPPMQMLASYRGDLYCAYPSPRGVFFTRSLDGGTTWSQPLQLGGAAGDALLPSIAVDQGSGDLIVAWLDGRDDAGGKTLRLYAARSTDGGAAFDTRPFSPPFAAGGRMGDYNGSASLRNGVAVTAFSAAGGSLMVERLVFDMPVRRRAVNH